MPVEGDDLGKIIQKWGNSYQVCQLKHEILKQCVEKYEQQKGSD